MEIPVVISISLVTRRLKNVVMCLLDICLYLGVNCQSGKILTPKSFLSQTSASLLISFHYCAKPEIKIGQKGPDVCD